MLNRICIKPQKGSQGLTNARLKAIFKQVFSAEPIMFRNEGKKIIIHTSLKLTKKNVKRFAKKLGSYTNFKGKDDSYSFDL